MTPCTETPYRSARPSSSPHPQSRQYPPGPAIPSAGPQVPLTTLLTLNYLHQALCMAPNSGKCLYMLLLEYDHMAYFKLCDCTAGTVNICMYLLSSYGEDWGLEQAWIFSGGHFSEIPTIRNLSRSERNTDIQGAAALHAFPGKGDTVTLGKMGGEVIAAICSQIGLEETGAVGPTGPEGPWSGELVGRQGMTVSLLCSR